MTASRQFSEAYCAVLDQQAIFSLLRPLRPTSSSSKLAVPPYLRLRHDAYDPAMPTGITAQRCKKVPATPFFATETKLATERGTPCLPPSFPPFPDAKDRHVRRSGH